jgi:AAA+ ATPase superfamily predicted ATPase
MREIIGRDKEKATLIACYESNKSEFVALYGRRRVGKTYLVKSLFSDSFVFYATGVLKGDKDAQLQMFNAELRRLDPAAEYAWSWTDAFEKLYSLVDGMESRGKKKVIFLDELPWMSSSGSDLLPALDYLWNRHLSFRDDIMLIICGSAAAWMIEHVVDDKGGLHNRLTRQILLQAMSLSECEEFYKMQGIPMTRYQLAEAYMIFGGIPFYMSLMQGDKSLYQNVDMLYFRAGAELMHEYDNLYSSLFGDSENHSKVVEAIAKKGKGLTREEIVSSTGLKSGGTLSKVLSDLEFSGFIREYQAYGKKAKGRLYQLIDPFTLFHLKFSEKRKMFSNNFWIQFSLTPAHSAWAGYAFELLCLIHLDRIKGKLGISGMLTGASSWRSELSDPGAQVDLVIDRADRIVNLCEMKYSGDEFVIDKEYDKKLRNKRSVFASETKTKKSVVTVMVTTYGLVRNAYAHEVAAEIVLDDFFV